MVRRFAVAAALVVFAAGCSSDSDATPVAWAEQVCSSVAPEVEKLKAGPDIDPSDPQSAKDGLVAYLNTLVSALDGMAAGIRDAGAPPVPDGEIAADRAVETLEGAKGSVEAAREELAAADVSDPTAFQSAFTKVSTDLQELAELDNPMEGLRGNEELDAAFQEAASCKQLSGSAP